MKNANGFRTADAKGRLHRLLRHFPVGEPAPRMALRRALCMFMCMFVISGTPCLPWGLSSAEASESPDSEADAKKSKKNSEADAKKSKKGSEADAEKSKKNSEADAEKSKKNSEADAEKNKKEAAKAGTPRELSRGEAATKAAVEENIYRWRLQAIENQEAAKRDHKEVILKRRLRIQLLSDGVELGDDAATYFICDNGTDYVVAEDNGEQYVYNACITRSGEYFLADDTINEGIRMHVSTLVDDSCLRSTEPFWNHVLLRDAPQTSSGTNQNRPTDANGVMMVPYFNQGAGYFVNGTWMYTEWPGVSFNVNGHTMSQAGCGFFSTAMALSYVLQRIVAPIDFKENGQYIAGGGSAVTVGVASASMYHVPAYMTSDINEVLMALRNGQPVMEHVGSPPFTNGGHYILLVGVLPDGTIAVNDPGHVENSYWYCGVSFPIETIMRCVKDPSTAFTVFG